MSKKPVGLKDFKIEMVPVVDLLPYVNNPKAHPAGQVDKIASSIKNFGFLVPLVVDSGNEIVCGHGRLLAAQKLGLGVVPCVRADNLTPAEIKAFRIMDNKSQESDWFPETLALELQALSEMDFDLELTGFDLDELEGMGIGGGDPPPEDPGPQIDRASELQEKWGTKRGQIWELPSKSAPGKSHRVMCGDSTSAEDVGRLLAGAKPNLMVTDPPYGIGLDATWRDGVANRMGKAQKGKLNQDDGFEWLPALGLSGADVVYVYHHHNFGSIIQACLEADGYQIKQQIVWVKTVHTLTQSHYQQKHEPCWYAVKKGKDAQWIGGRDQMSAFELASPKHIMSGSDEEKQPHPTQKPLEAFMIPIRNHEGDVYDPFLGSGTTLIAAEQLGRVCYGMEIAPEYVGVILERAVGIGLSPKLIETVK